LQLEKGTWGKGTIVRYSRRRERERCFVLQVAIYQEGDKEQEREGSVFRRKSKKRGLRTGSAGMLNYDVVKPRSIKFGRKERRFQARQENSHKPAPPGGRTASRVLIPALEKERSKRSAFRSW